MQKLAAIFGIFNKQPVFRSEMEGYLTTIMKKSAVELKAELKGLIIEHDGLSLEVASTQFKKLNPVDNSPSNQPNQLKLLTIVDAKIAALKMLLAINHQVLQNAESAEQIYALFEKQLLVLQENVRSKKIESTPDFIAELEYLQNTFLPELYVLVNPATGFTIIENSEASGKNANSNVASVKKVKAGEGVDKTASLTRDVPEASKMKNPQKVSAVSSRVESGDRATDAAYPNGVFHDNMKQLKRRERNLSTLLAKAQDLEEKTKQAADLGKQAHFATKK